MRRPFVPFLVAALLALALVVPGPADAATKRRKKAVRRPVPTPTERPYYGPPAPTPAPWRRAAGACMEYTPGQYLVVAEVGATGRVFRVDGETKIETEVRKGLRVRILYVDRPEGPVARRILPGPIAAPPPPRTP